MPWRPLAASPVGFPSTRKPERVSVLRLLASVKPEGRQRVSPGRAAHGPQQNSYHGYPCAQLGRCHLCCRICRCMLGPPRVSPRASCSGDTKVHEIQDSRGRFSGTKHPASPRRGARGKRITLGRGEISWFIHSFIQKWHFMPTMCRAFHKDLGLHRDKQSYLLSFALEDNSCLVGPGLLLTLSSLLQTCSFPPLVGIQTNW